MQSSIRLTAAALGAVLLALAPPVPAQQSGPIPTVTRLVKLYLEREDQMLTAMRARDAAALERMLADDFELRVAARPGVPVPRADFLQRVGTEATGAYAIEQMAVHEIGTTSIVSFLLRPAARDRSTPPLFVVDTWVGGGDDARLRVRYVAPAAAARIPGAAADTPQIPKKY